MTDVKKVFNPEFLNRLDEIIVFHPLTQEDIFQILDIMMVRVNKRLEDKKITLHLSDEVKAHLAETGYDAEYGARPLRRVIQRSLEDPLSHLLISGEVPENSDITAALEEGKVTFQFNRRSENPAPEPALSGSK
jgi:ATP-dependent Clp protease ATP-binding subunit ClpC